MELISVMDPRFRPYGHVIEGYDTKQLHETMLTMPVPEEGITYVASVPELEALPIAEKLFCESFGELDPQVGYVCGQGNKLNALEYHRSSEFNYAVTDLILLLGRQQDVEPGTFTYDTSKVEAFHVPAGTMLEVYATTLHYAPCSYQGGKFQFVVVLPRGTNTPLEKPHSGVGEDKLITDKNKWLIAHPESGLDPAKVHIGLIGENLTV